MSPEVSGGVSGHECRTWGYTRSLPPLLCRVLSLTHPRVPHREKQHGSPLQIGTGSNRPLQAKSAPYSKTNVGTTQKQIVGRAEVGACRRIKHVGRP